MNSGTLSTSLFVYKMLWIMFSSAKKFLLKKRLENFALSTKIC